jgi:hypothetical protein
LAGVSKTIAAVAGATAFRVLYWWRQHCKQISNGCLEIFKKIITLLTVTVIFLFTFFNLILDAQHINDSDGKFATGVNNTNSFFIFIDSRSLEHFSQFFVDKIQRQFKRIYTTIKHSAIYKSDKLFRGRDHFRNSQPSRLEAAGTARAAGAATVAGVAGEGGVAAGAVATRLVVLVPVLAVPEVASGRGRRVRRRRRRRGGRPEAFPAATVWFWLQEVHQTHGQLDVRAFVTVNRVGPPIVANNGNNIRLLTP